MDITQFSTSELLKLHASSLLALKQRGVVRTLNAPTGDLAEYLFCNAFGWQMAKNSKAGYDATDVNGQRYQIKARKLNDINKSGERCLSAFRGLDDKKFDMLAVILFNADYSIYRAVLLPHEFVLPNCSGFSAHTNAHIFYARDAFLDNERSIDVTEALRASLKAL